MKTRQTFKNFGVGRKAFGFLLGLGLVFNLFPATALAQELPPYAPIIMVAADQSKEYDGTPLHAQFSFVNLPENVVNFSVEPDPNKTSITEPGSLQLTDWCVWSYALYDSAGSNLTHRGLGAWVYDFGTLSITKRNITVSADNKTMTAGEAVPELTVNETGSSFLAGDAPSYDLQVAGDTSVPGSYDILLSVSYPDTARHEKYYDVTVVAGEMLVSVAAGENEAQDELNDAAENESVVDDENEGFEDEGNVALEDDASQESLNESDSEQGEASQDEVGEVADEGATNTNVFENLQDAVYTFAAVPEVAASEVAPIISIEDEATPLTQNSVRIVPVAEIEDAETPLAAPSSQSTWALWNLILTLVTGALMAVLLGGYFAVRKHRTEEQEHRQEVKRKGIARVLSVAVTLAALIVFIATQNMSSSMVMVDQWTVVIAIIAATQIALALLATKGKKTSVSLDAQTVNG